LEQGTITLDEVQHTKAYAIAEEQLAAHSEVETSSLKKEDNETN
jgi:hypothetical protein